MVRIARFAFDDDNRDDPIFVDALDAEGDRPLFETPHAGLADGRRGRRRSRNAAVEDNPAAGMNRSRRNSSRRKAA